MRKTRKCVKGLRKHRKKYGQTKKHLKGGGKLGRLAGIYNKKIMSLSRYRFLSPDNTLKINKVCTGRDGSIGSDLPDDDPNSMWKFDLNMPQYEEVRNTINTAMNKYNECIASGYPEEACRGVAIADQKDFTLL